MSQLCKIMKIGLIFIIGLSIIGIVRSQDDEGEEGGWNESVGMEPYFSGQQHDFYGSDNSEMDFIDHRLGEVGQQEAKNLDLENLDKPKENTQMPTVIPSEPSAQEANSEDSDLKPAESLLTMSIDPLSDGMGGDPDIKSVLANAEAQEEIASSSSNRVPHQLNLAVGSASSYQSGPPPQFQYTQPALEVHQAPPPPPGSIITDEHRKAIAQLALQQQATLTQQAQEQRDIEQKRIEQETLQYQQQQYLQQQDQYLQQQFAQQAPTAAPQPQYQLHQQNPLIAPELHQQQVIAQQQQPLIYSPSVAPQAQPQHVIQQQQVPVTHLQYNSLPQQTPTQPQQVLQYQQQFSDPTPTVPQFAQQQVIQPQNNLVGNPPQTLQTQPFVAQPQQPLFQTPTQLQHQPVQAPQPQQVYQTPTQAPSPQQQFQQVYQTPSPQTPIQVQQQQVFQDPTQQQQVFQDPTHQQQVFQDPTQQQQVFQDPTQQQLLYNSPSQLPQLQPQQQQVLQLQGPTQATLIPQPQQQIYTIPSPTPVLQQQVYQNPSETPIQQVQQYQQPYQNAQLQVQQQQQQQVPIQQQFQHYQNPSIAPSVHAPIQHQQLTYQTPSIVPQQEIAQPQTVNHVAPAPVPTQFVQPQQYQQPQQVEQPTSAPKTTAQYHIQISPPPTPTQSTNPNNNAFGHQTTFTENTLALGSEHSELVSHHHPEATGILAQDQQHQQGFHHQPQHYGQQEQKSSQNKSPPKNIQQILSQQSSQSEISDESDYQNPGPQDQPLQQQQHYQDPQPSSPEVEATTRYPQTQEVQQEYEQAINNSQMSVPEQEQQDASQELTNYAQTIEERAAQILENFRRQVLGEGKPAPAPTPEQILPSPSAAIEPELSSQQHQVHEAVNSNTNQYSEPTEEPHPSQPSVAFNVEPPPAVQQEPAQPQFQDVPTIPPTPAQQQQQQQQDALNEQKKKDDDKHMAQLLENEIIQEGSASIQNQVIHRQNVLAQYPQGAYQQQHLQAQLQPNVGQIPTQHQQQLLQQQQFQQPASPPVPSQPAPNNQQQDVIKQVIETQAIQQNSLQQLWQLYQQQVYQNQQLIQQQAQQRQQQQEQQRQQQQQAAIAGQILSPQPQYSQLPPSRISNLPKTRLPNVNSNPYAIPGAYVQSSSPVTFPTETYYTQPQQVPNISPQEGTLFYQQFVGPAIPPDVHKPPSLHDTSPYAQIQENTHYTIYKVKEDASPLNAYRSLTGVLPSVEQQQQQQQLRGRTQQIQASQSVGQANYNVNAQQQGLPQPPVPPVSFNGYPQQQQQAQVIPAPTPSTPPGQELLALEEVGKVEEPHAYLQLPVVPSIPAQPAGQTGPSQAPLTSAPTQSEQANQYSDQSQPGSKPGSTPGSEFYQVQSHSYVMPSEPPQLVTTVYHNYPTPAPMIYQNYQVQQQPFESLPAYSQDHPSFATSYQQQQNYPPAEYSQFHQRGANNQRQKSYPGSGIKINYPKPVITSISKPSKKLRKNQGYGQHSMVANMEYRPEVLLPADEASFAAHQAKILGGPDFRDEGYNNLPQHQQSPRGHLGSESPSAESFGFSLQPLLRLGKLSAKAFRNGFNDKVQRDRLSNNNSNRRNSGGSSSSSEDSMAASGSAPIPARLRSPHRNRQDKKGHHHQPASLLEKVQQVFSPRVGENLEIKEIIAPVTKVKKSKSTIKQDLIADLIKASSTTDSSDEIETEPKAAEES